MDADKLESKQQRYKGKSILVSCFLLFAFYFLLLASCQDRFFKKPEITLQKIEISSITLKEIGVNLTADISNPNLIDVEIEKFLYKITIEGNEMVSGELKEKVKIKSNESAPFIVSAKIDIGSPDLWNTALKALNGNKVNYKIEGAILLNTSVGKKNINIDNTGEYMLEK